MQLITNSLKLQIESDRPPFLCGACNFYADCFVRREEEEVNLFSLQFEFCHKEKGARSYLPDDQLILIYDDFPPEYWECDCDEDYVHLVTEEVCGKCGVRCDDPTE
jgi:transcription elongation factor Elf1